MGDTATATPPQQPAPSPSDEHVAKTLSATIAGTTQQNKVKVLIIGAGVAGLSAANHLLQNGCDSYRILEARNRIGGRIVSIPMGAIKVELGANWIHGVLGNPIFEIAVQHGLVSVVNIPKSHKVVATTEDGHQVPFQILQEIYEAYVCFLRRCDEYFLCQYSPPPDIHSVGEHINYEIEIYLSSVQDQKEKRLKQLIFNCLLKRETCITGCHNMNEIDLLELGSYTELQGGNIVLPAGYSSILRPLTAAIPREAIITKCPVKKIHWKRKKTLTGLETVDENSEDENSDDSEKTVTEIATGIGVGAGNATDVVADATNATATTTITTTIQTTTTTTTKTTPPPTTITTTSTSTSTSTSTTSTSRTARSSSVESNDSCDLDDDTDYSVRVTCEDGRTFYAEHVICTIPLGVLKQTHKTLFDPELPRYKQESIDNLMFGTVDKIFLEYERPFLSADISEVLLLWDDDKYELNTSSDEKMTVDYLQKNWFKKIYSFAKITDTLLLGWVSGREAEYMETLTFEVIAEKCTEILRNFLQDPFVPKPKRCVCTSWKAQKYTCGAYTSIPVGALQEDIETLAQPLYATPHEVKPAVLFAGEHTHSNFYSTVHGAYLSGRTAAQYLLTSDEPDEIIMESDGSDLSAWIQGIALD